MSQPVKLFTGHSEWKGKPYITELYSSDDCLTVSPITQVQAVCFTDPNHIVFYKNIEGFLGNPGGGVEPNESYEETLKRELVEEAQLEMLDCRFFGYEYIINVTDNSKNTYFLRAVAKVKLIDTPINDPCGKAIGRVVVDTKDAGKILNWGEKGEILIKLATDKYKATWDD